MKHVRHLLVAALTVFLAAVLAVPAFAADATYTITINRDGTDHAAHTYGAYQLFKGDLAEVDGKNVLSNVQWGDNVNSATLITKLNDDLGFNLAANASASDVAKAISDANYTTDSAGAKALAEALNAALTGDPKGTGSIAADGTGPVTISGLVAGYYLVKDTGSVSGEGAQTRYILEVVKNVEVTEKASVPSVDKEIAETTPTKVSDYSIGDPIPYTITGTLPSNFEEFVTYKTFTFTDEMSAGLTPPAADAVTVKIGNDDITNLFDVTVAEQVLTVKLKSTVDLRTAKHGTGDGTAFAAGDKIVVSYSATLNDDAVIGGTGNINTVTLEFSNNPNSGGDGDTGTTPPDKTVVFTYEIDALKVQPDGDPITQAAYDQLTDEEKADYVKVGDKWQKTKSLAGAGFTLYKKNATGGWDQVGNEVTGVTTFKFEGVDVGDYKLVETTTPSGFNTCAPIEITVSATYTTDKPAEIASLTVTPPTAGFTADMASGIVSGKILNQSGSVLPSTGGMGTTILYIVGGGMVIAGIVMFLTKRRMASVEK